MKIIPVSMYGVKASKKVLVDDEDYDSVAQFRWYETRGGYACSNSSPIYRIHRYILNAKKGEVIDHINGNKLDNRKENLRFCSRAENCRNRRKSPDGRSLEDRGAYYMARLNQWQSSIHVDGRLEYIGLFASKEDANNAYKKASLEHYGEFSPYFNQVK